MNMKQKKTRTGFAWTCMVLVVTILAGCAAPVTTWSDKCRGFPFDKKFPVRTNRPFSIMYNPQYTWITGKDGIIYHTFLYGKYTRERFRKTYYYNSFQLPHSDREKAYLARYEAKEREFDKKYAGWIKKALLDATSGGYGTGKTKNSST